MEEPPFVEKKEAKVDYSKIFGDESKKEKKSGRKSKLEKKKSLSSIKEKSVAGKSSVKKTPKKAAESPKTPNQKPITHPRFVQGSDHQVRILSPPSTPYHVDTYGGLATPKSIPPNYRCPLCDFVASRLNVIVLHSKSHSASNVSYAVNKSDSPRRKEEQRARPEESPAKKRDKSTAFVAKKRDRPPLGKQDKKTTPVANKKPRLVLPMV